MILQPFEEGPVAEKTVLHHFGVAGAPLTWRQCRQHFRVGENQKRLVEGTDEILAVTRVDTGLSADGAVHLGEQGGGDLDERDAAAQQARRQPGQIADDSAAKRHHAVATLDPRIEKIVKQVLEMTE